jgi:hypothetical protein
MTDEWVFLLLGISSLHACVYVRVCVFCLPVISSNGTRACTESTTALCANYTIVQLIYKVCVCVAWSLATVAQRHNLLRNFSFFSLSLPMGRETVAQLKSAACTWANHMEMSSAAIELKWVSMCVCDWASWGVGVTIGSLKDLKV